MQLSCSQMHLPSPLLNVKDPIACIPSWSLPFPFNAVLGISFSSAQQCLPPLRQVRIGKFPPADYLYYHSCYGLCHTSPTFPHPFAHLLTCLRKELPSAREHALQLHLPSLNLLGTWLYVSVEVHHRWDTAPAPIKEPSGLPQQDSQPISCRAMT